MTGRELMEQRREALATANDVRSRRRMLRQHLHNLDTPASRRAAAEVLRDPEWWLLTARCRDLIQWTRYGGPRLTVHIQRKTGVDLDQLIGGMTLPARRRVARALVDAARALERHRPPKAAA